MYARKNPFGSDGGIHVGRPDLSSLIAPGERFLLWWLGIAAQFALLLLAIGIWFGVEINDSTSLIRFDDEHQVLVYALLGLVFTGFGFMLRRSANKDFSNVAETVGLLGLSVFSYPLTWSGFLSWGYRHEGLNPWLLPALGCRNLTTLSRNGAWLGARRWRVRWRCSSRQILFRNKMDGFGSAT